MAEISLCGNFWEKLAKNLTKQKLFARIKNMENPEIKSNKNSVNSSPENNPPTEWDELREMRPDVSPDHDRRDNSSDGEEIADNKEFRETNDDAVNDAVGFSGLGQEMARNNREHDMDEAEEKYGDSEKEASQEIPEAEKKQAVLSEVNYSVRQEIARLNAAVDLSGKDADVVNNFATIQQTLVENMAILDAAQELGELDAAAKTELMKQVQENMALLENLNEKITRMPNSAEKQQMTEVQNKIENNIAATQKLIGDDESSRFENLISDQKIASDKAEFAVAGEK